MEVFSHCPLGQYYRTDEDRTFFFFPFRILILHKDCSWSFLALEGAAALVRGRPDGDQVCQFLGLSIEAVIVSFLGSIE